MSEAVVNYILNALNRSQNAGVQGAKDFLSVVELLQKPLNAEDLEKEQYETLKTKFDKPTEEKKEEKTK